MTTLTKEQRKEVFEIAIETFDINSIEHEFLCIHLKNILIDYFHLTNICAEDVPEILPELDLFNPKNNGYAWLSDRKDYQSSNNHRAIVLLFCLELTNKLINKLK